MNTSAGAEEVGGGRKHRFIPPVSEKNGELAVDVESSRLIPWMWMNRTTRRSCVWSQNVERWWGAAAAWRNWTEVMGFSPCRSLAWRRKIKETWARRRERCVSEQLGQ
jgi:hypothetical protein